VVGGTAYVANRTGDIHALDVATGERRGGLALGVTLRHQPNVAEGAVFVVESRKNIDSVESVLYALRGDGAG